MNAVPNNFMLNEILLYAMFTGHKRIFEKLNIFRYVCVYPMALIRVPYSACEVYERCRYAFHIL